MFQDVDLIWYVTEFLEVTQESIYGIDQGKLIFWAWDKWNCFHSQFAAQVEELTAEANKERKLRARSDQVNNW